ncbi:MAG: hypothetical protein GYB67_01075 [Chloroflexi bacterium]|nr:hypothetical protein [Chloroflexota bacterium]
MTLKIKGIALLIAVMALLAATALTVVGQEETFTGVVFEDLNGNLTLDADEPGIEGVMVTNGIQVVLTNAEGVYELPVRDEMVVVVTKPNNYDVPYNENLVPQNYYIHQPNGSPDFIQTYAGIEPTGDLPESVDFPLYATEVVNDFSFLVYGDTQVANQQELGYMREVMAELYDTGDEFAFGIAVGDLLDDPLDLYPQYLDVMSLTGSPTWYVPGNHDLNFDSTNDIYHLETYKTFFGSPNYSFDFGQAHFISLDNIRYQVDFPGTYNGRLTDDQLQWLENDLALVPEDKLIVLSMHIGLTNFVDRDAVRHQDSTREQVYEIVSRFDNVISLAGHSHTLERMLTGEEYTPEDPEAFGWGEIPFDQFVAGAVCGSWWGGELNTFGLPESYQRCGAPRGYMVFDISGNTYSERWKASGFAEDYGMHISFDVERNAARSTFVDLGLVSQDHLETLIVVANVFSGGENTVVEMSIDGGDPIPMVRDWNARDPFVISRTGALGHGTRGDRGQSMHLYVADMPTDLEPGVHIIEITATDPYGQVWTGLKTFDVWASN